MVRVLVQVGLDVVDRIAEAVPEVEVVRIPASGEVDPGTSGEVLLTVTVGIDNLEHVLTTRDFAWVHAFGTGVERFPFHLLGDAVLTCSRGASAVPIAEFVLACLLAAEKQLPDVWIDAPPERWSRARLGTLRDREVALVGIGGIGAEVARLAQAFGARVRATRRRDAPSPVPGVEIAPLEDLLPTADHLVIAAPSTGRTRALLDAEAFALAKPGLHVVNIARGDLIDQDALLAALDEGQVGLASLDVCDPEPLPDGHPLYAHPRVRLSPHVSWSAPGAQDEILDRFIDNLRRYVAGEPLDGVVDPGEGY